MKKINVLVIAPVETVSGYGARSRDIVKSLLRNDKYNVQIIPTRWGNTPRTALNVNDPLDMKIASLFTSPQLKSKPDICITIGLPNEFANIGERNIGITAGIETTVCRPEWIEGCNRVDLVLVSSDFSKQVFEEVSFKKHDRATNAVVGELKLTTPCEVLFEGLNTDIFGKAPDDVDKEIIQHHLKDVKEKFCYLVVGHWLNGEFGHDRKNIGMTLSSILHAFKGRPARTMPAIVLKVSEGGFSEPEYASIKTKIRAIQKMASENGKKAIPNIYLLRGQMTDYEMNALYKSNKIKAMCLLTHGEGFGRPFLEFASCGKPIIASNWSGHTMFLKQPPHFLIDGKLEKVHPSAVNDWILPEAEWFIPDYGKAVAAIRQVHDEYKNIVSQCKNYAKQLKQNYSLSRMDEKLYEFLDGVMNGDIGTAKLVELSIPKL